MRDIRAWGYVAFDAFCIDIEALDDPVREGNWAVTSYDLGLVRDYVAQGMAEICPALVEAGHSLRPYDYVALLDRHAGNPAARWQRRLLRLFGVHHAWVVPLSSVRFVKGVGVYMQGRGPAAAQHFAATRDRVHLRAIDFYAELEATRPPIPADFAHGAAGAQVLSPREAECLAWAAAGHTNVGIAAAIGISVNTVRFHFKNVLAKLDARSRAQAVALYAAAARSRTAERVGVAPSDEVSAEPHPKG